MSAILVRDGDKICDKCVFGCDIPNYNDFITCPRGFVPEVVDKSPVGDFVVCDGFCCVNMVDRRQFYVC